MGERYAKQFVRIVTETSDVVDKKFGADIGYVTSPDDVTAWGLNRTQQAKDLQTGRYIQLLSERNAKPIKVFRNSGSDNDIVGCDIETIARQGEDRAQQESERDRPKDGRILWIGIIATMITIAFLLVLWKVIA
jgi:hypothetical protein